MSGLLFQEAQPVVAASPNRADIVCFVGYIARRATALPAPAKTWLQDHGWRPLTGAPADIDDLDPLLDTPVPLESFAAFDHLFAWENRPTDARGHRHPTWLGAAVRSFFRQGGARCIVVRVGDPWIPACLAADASDADRAEAATVRLARLRRLFPGYAGTSFPSPRDSSTWLGHGVLLGLAEVATLCFPDLPEIVADAALEPTGLAPLPPSPETFVECGPEVPLPPDETRQVSPSPACTTDGYIRWCGAVRAAALFLKTHRPDAQLLLALPLPAPGDDGGLMRLLDDPMQPHGLAQSTDLPGGIASAHVQLAYPWVVTPGAEALPGGLEPPDGVFAGVLARALPRLGVARSLGAQPLNGVFAFSPAPPAPDLLLDTPRGARPALIHRVSLLGRTPDGPRVLSDVTTSLESPHRPACVRRLTAAILRTARQLGDTVVFDSSGPRLWRVLQDQLESLLADFHAAGALAGASAAEAYRVRCDATTTSQNDLDNGRVVAEVRFAPAHPVGLITVTLALREGNVAAQGTPSPGSASVSA